MKTAARLKHFLFLLVVVCCIPFAKAQEYPTVEKHVAGLIRQGMYADAVKLLEENLPRYKSDTAYREYFNWMGSLYLHQKKWDQYIALYKDYVYEPGEDSTLLSAARLYRQYPESIQTDPSKAWVPFTTSRRSSTPRVKVRINGKKYRFWVDTGAGLSVVTNKVADQCGLKQYIPGKGMAISATGRAVDIYFAIIDSLQGAGLSVKNHPCLVLNKKDLRFKILGITIVKIDGLIGWNLLQELAVDMDFPHKKIRFTKPEHEVPERNSNFFWMEQPMVKVTTERNENLDFFIDTGASNSALYQAILGRIDTSAVITKTITLGSAGGLSTMKTFVLPDLKLTAGGQTLNMKDIAVSPMPYSESAFTRYGVLGSNELKTYVLHFSLKDGIFRLTPP